MKNAAGNREMLNLFEPQASYRKDGPETSKAAAILSEKSGSAATLRLRVLQAVRDRPGLTAGEYAEWMDVERAVVSRRLPELLAKGFVEKGRKRPCNTNSVPAAVWTTVEENAS